VSLKQASVRNASIQGIFTPGDVSPLVVPEIVNLPIIFSSVSNIQKTDGSYTPNNDTHVIHTFAAGDQANFILLIIDNPAVLDLQSTANASMITNMCAQRFFYMGLQTLPSGLTVFSMNGAASGPEVPMSQGIACNYTLLYGMAALS
jgi:hypothetical protein